MALLEDKYAPEMERKEALKLALECCRVLMSGGREKREEKEEVGREGGEKKKEKKEEEEEEEEEEVKIKKRTSLMTEAGPEEGEEDLMVAGVDVALISREGVRMWESVSPVEKLLDLVEDNWV